MDVLICACDALMAECCCDDTFFRNAPSKQNKFNRYNTNNNDEQDDDDDSVVVCMDTDTTTTTTSENDDTQIQNQQQQQGTKTKEFETLVQLASDIYTDHQTLRPVPGASIQYPFMACAIQYVWQNNRLVSYLQLHGHCLKVLDKQMACTGTLQISCLALVVDILPILSNEHGFVLDVLYGNAAITRQTAISNLSIDDLMSPFGSRGSFGRVQWAKTHLDNFDHKNNNILTFIHPWHKCASSKKKKNETVKPRTRSTIAKTTTTTTTTATTRDSTSTTNTRSSEKKCKNQHQAQQEQQKQEQEDLDGWPIMETKIQILTSSSSSSSSQHETLTPHGSDIIVSSISYPGAFMANIGICVNVWSCAALRGHIILSIQQ